MNAERCRNAGCSVDGGQLGKVVVGDERHRRPRALQGQTPAFCYRPWRAQTNAQRVQAAPPLLQVGFVRPTRWHVAAISFSFATMPSILRTGSRQRQTTPMRQPRCDSAPVRMPNFPRAMSPYCACAATVRIAGVPCVIFCDRAGAGAPPGTNCAFHTSWFAGLSTVIPSVVATPSMAGCKQNGDSTVSNKCRPAARRRRGAPKTTRRIRSTVGAMGRPNLERNDIGPGANAGLAKLRDWPVPEPTCRGLLLKRPRPDASGRPRPRPPHTRPARQPIPIDVRIRGARTRLLGATAPQLPPLVLHATL